MKRYLHELIPTLTEQFSVGGLYLSCAGRSSTPTLSSIHTCINIAHLYKAAIGNSPEITFGLPGEALSDPHPADAEARPGQSAPAPPMSCVSSIGGVTSHRQSHRLVNGGWP
eukprot:scaffold218867_cov29-Prasinocladus_malaysianus.AAC.1